MISTVLTEPMQQITIVVPACDRSETLVHTLETCIVQKDERLRILVSDNVSQDSTKEVVEDFMRKDSRVAYTSPGTRLGMSEHWEFAIDHVNDGFVMIIGDDDGLLPDAMARIRKAMEFAPDLNAISWPFCTYFYPDLPPMTGLHRLPNDHMGICTTPGQEIRNYRTWLNFIASSYGAYNSLPGIYHGLLHIDVLKQLKKDTGRYIHCIAPDIYVAVALSKYMDRYVFLRQPASILGVSKKSNGFNQLMVDEHQNEIAKRHLAETKIHFHKDIQYTPNLPIFVAEALLQAKDAGCLPAAVSIDWDAFLLQAHCEFRTTNFNDEVEREMRYTELEEICAKFGSPGLFERLNREKPEYDWSKYHCDPYEAVLDLSKLNIKNIADACRLAQVLCLANIGAPTRTRFEEGPLTRLALEDVPRHYLRKMRDTVRKTLDNPSLIPLKGKAIDASALAYRVYSRTYHTYAGLRNKILADRRT